MRIKNGDKVMVSDRNKNHLGFGVTAYAGWQGTVSDLDDKGYFTIDSGSGALVISRTTWLLVEDISGSWVRIKHRIKRH